MKVLFFHTGENDSIESRVHKSFANGHSRSDLELHFIWQASLRKTFKNVPAQTDRPNNTRFFDFGRDQGIVCKTRRLGRAWMMGKQWFKANRFVLDVMHEVKPDLLYTSQRSWDIKRAAQLSKRFGIPYLAHIHYPVGEWLGKEVLPLLRQADKIITASHFVRDTAVQHGIEEARIEVIHNPVELDRYALSRNREWLPAELGIAPNAVVIVVVGRLDPTKGHDLLIEAMPQIVAKCPPIVVLACGKNSNGTDYLEQLRKRCAELNLNPYFHFLGFRSDVAQIMAASDIFCLPTREEAFGVVFVEAMAAGLPVVSLCSGAVPEIVQDGVTGLLSHDRDTKGLATNLLTLAQTPALREQMGIAGRARAYAHFAPEQLANQWADFLVEGR